MKIQKSEFVEAFRTATQKHTRNCSVWSCKADRMVMSPYPYPIPSGKYTIDENFGDKEICIRCKRVWTEDLILVAKKVASKFGATVSSYTVMGGFGTAYNFFTVTLK